MLTVDSMLTLTAAGLYAHSYLKSLIFEALPKSHWLESRSKGLVCVLLLNSFIPENADEQTSGTALRLSSGNRRPTHSHFGFVCSVLALEAETHQSPPVYSASAKLLNKWKIRRKSLSFGGNEPAPGYVWATPSRRLQARCRCSDRPSRTR